VNSPETQFASRETALDRDAFVYREQLLEIAVTVALEERSEIPAQESPRVYMYVVIDLAEEAGFRIDQLEAISLLEKARTKISDDGRFQSNYEDGTWDEHGNTIDYAKEDKAGEK
jgi:hypothetical protein